ncbi:MAG TPA: aminotransferase class I/II-fold pyridoxal phosphate-dependent enzyme [Gammaproteobacteria bacterium]|nr:aminotransferase class I/II-fold pyridoxal phosphate-dependent enzyme [Gammaproteobacteria bacterium]
MKFPAFKIEDYFTQYEFSAKYMMGSSDAESFTVSELLSMAGSDSLSLWNHLKLGYTESYGLPILREEIAKLYQTINSENIVVSAGAEEGMFIALHLLIEPGDEVLVVTPAYQSLKEIPRLLGAKLTECSLEWHANKWVFNLEKFADLLTAKTRLVIMNFPHNPTGYLPTHQEFASILQIVKDHGCYFFCDEVYRLSEQRKEDCLPAAVDCYDKAISLGVMSKSFGLAGLRIGWVASQDKSWLRSFVSNKNYTSICNSAPSEVLALIALQNKEKLLNRNLAIAKENLDLLDQFFMRYPSLVDWYRPSAGYVCFPRLKLQTPIEHFAKQLVDEKDVLILPGTLFDNNANHFRIGYGRKNLSEALALFEEFIQT